VHAGDRKRADTGSPIAKGATFIEYQRNVVRAIRENWVWSGEKRNQRALVQFGITDKGEVTRLRIVESSGDALYDESLLVDLSKSSPLPAPPAILRKAFSLVELNFEPWMLGDSLW
jgi:TonB family protein